MKKLNHRKLLNINVSTLEEGIKYIAFKLKLVDYDINDWSWLLKKCEKKIYNWCLR